ncbi:hypothetical protein E1508_09235 [Pseudomonas moraviensis]|nr:hypothetical protein E1508_09235 [Pseudomonas moraviensis]
MKITVGASLLAKAVCQPTLMLMEPPHSRAGSLPQGDVLISNGCDQTTPAPCARCRSPENKPTSATTSPSPAD